MTNRMAVAPKAEPKKRSFLWRAVQLLFLGAAIGFTVVQINKNWNSVRDSAANIHPNWMMLIAASGVVLATYAALIQSWRTLIEGEGSSLSFPTAARIWFIANLGRYIPGKVWSIAALNVMAAREGVPGAAAAGAAVLGTLINIGAGFGVIAVSGSRVLDGVPTDYRALVRTGSLVGSVLFVVGVIALPWILPATAEWAARKFGKTIPPVRLPAKNLFVSVTINIVSWFCYGWAFMVFTKAVMPETSGSLAEFTAVWTTSYIVGYLAFFAPGGIIFREGVMIGMLAALGMASASDAALIAATSRLWLSLVEVLPGLIALTFSSSQTRLRPDRH